MQTFGQVVCSIVTKLQYSKFQTQKILTELKLCDDAELKQIFEASQGCKIILHCAKMYTLVLNVITTVCLTTHLDINIYKISQCSLYVNMEDNLNKNSSKIYFMEKVLIFIMIMFNDVNHR